VTEILLRAFGIFGADFRCEHSGRTRSGCTSRASLSNRARPSKRRRPSHRASVESHR
jgi:hypothetical protein